MVSYQTPLPPSRRRTIPEFENFPKKRKWEEPKTEEIFEKPLKDQGTMSVMDVELHQETPLPSEWQRCLDIQSGQIHFYNTETRTRTVQDPRKSPEPTSSSHMSLDLELNLPCGSLEKNHANNDSHSSSKHNSGVLSRNSSDQLMNILDQDKKSPGRQTSSPSWLVPEGDQQEMVTAVCMQCHMLVLLCKSSPACPNCKFMHPPNQSPPNLFKRRFSLLC